MLLDPRCNAQDHQDRGHQHGPQLNVQNNNVVGCLRRRADRRKLQHQQGIATHAVVLVDLLPPLDTAEDLGGEEVLHDAHEHLQRDADVGDQTHHAMGRGEALVMALVDLDDDERGNESQVTQHIEAEMDACPERFLLGGVRWLQGQDGLHLEEHGRGVQELGNAGQR